MQGVALGVKALERQQALGGASSSRGSRLPWRLPLQQQQQQRRRAVVAAQQQQQQQQQRQQQEQQQQRRQLAQHHPPTRRRDILSNCHRPPYEQDAGEHGAQARIWRQGRRRLRRRRQRSGQRHSGHGFLGSSSVPLLWEDIPQEYAAGECELVLEFGGGGGSIILNHYILPWHTRMYSSLVFFSAYISDSLTSPFDPLPLPLSPLSLSHCHHHQHHQPRRDGSNPYRLVKTRAVVMAAHPAPAAVRS